MSQRALLRDIQSRKNFICQSCLSALRSQTPNTLGIRHSSQSSRLKPSPRSRQTSRLPLRTQNQLPISSSKTRSNGESETPDSEAASALLRELLNKSDEPKIQFFEKDEKGDVTKLRDDDAFSKALSGKDDFDKTISADLAGEIKQLLSSVSKDGILSRLGIGDTGAFVKELESELGGLDTTEGLGEKLDVYIKNLEDQLEEQADVMEHYENPSADAETLLPRAKKTKTIPQIPTDVWNFNQRKRLSKLNTILERVHRELRRREETTGKTIQSTWKAYNLARQTLAKGWNNVPHDVWDLLWKILSIEGDTNPNRFTYLSLLARDMSEAKIALNPEQQLITVEALFVEGFEDKAIENWKRCMASLGDGGSDTFQAFWELGVRMFCQSGDLVQAERAINKLLERQMDPRIMMPYIRACAALPADDAQEKAWEGYRRMRDLLGPSMQLDDYDEVISFFLSTNQTERALFAFVDMMSSGTVDLRGRDRLPSQIGNKFFFGKWLKRLIGAGDLDGAYNVFTFMRSKGVEPAPIQINGLIGAWQRAGGAEHLKKADDLAWDMIRARVDFVKTRQRSASFRAQVTFYEARSTEGAMPKATRETFSLLAENYRLRGLQEQMNELWDAFRDAEISPDAFMMNQLMESYSQFGNIQEARDLYMSLVHERGVKPDGHTFMALWKMLGANRLQIVSDERAFDEVRGARETFAEMVRFSDVFAGEALDGQLARKLMHTFRRVKDQIGLIVALRALRAKFNYTPPEILALELVVGTTNLAWNTASARQKVRIVKRKIDAFVEHRQRGIGSTALTLEDMTGKQRGDAMVEYLEVAFMPQAPEVKSQLVEAAREMGVYDILSDTTGR